MSRSTHIIHRVNLDIEAPDVRTARELQDGAASLFYNDILPRLEKWLDSLVPEDQYVRIENIDLELDRMDRFQFDNLFSETTFLAIQAEIESIFGPSKDAQGHDFTEISGADHLFQEFTAFLESGRFPWWSTRDCFTTKDEKAFIVYLRSDHSHVSRLAGFLRTNPGAISRLILQFPARFAMQILSTILQGRIDLKEDDIVQVISQLIKRFHKDEKTAAGYHRQQTTAFLTKIFKHVLSFDVHLAQNVFSDIFLELKTEMRTGPDEALKHGTTGESLSLRKLKEEEMVISDKTEGEDGIYVTNAGLILLHPFLEYFFRDFDLFTDSQFKNDDCRVLAAHLLHFLAAGEENGMEPGMVMEKYLAGLDLDMPIDRYVNLTDEMKKESVYLLRAAIGHWKALKSTSPDGLREGFLQRDGKLIRSEFQHRLIIENRAHDVLLSYLPWGYGIVKLPWLSKPLFVEWNT